MNKKPQIPRPEKALVIRTGLKVGRTFRPGTKLPSGQVVLRNGDLSEVPREANYLMYSPTTDEM